MYGSGFRIRISGPQKHIPRPSRVPGRMIRYNSLVLQPPPQPESSGLRDAWFMKDERV